jgi:hypothetical protein
MSRSANARARQYLAGLKKALRGLPRARRTEITRDIRAHIETTLAAAPTPSPAFVEEMLDRLGPPEEIAAAVLAQLPPARGHRLVALDVVAIVSLLVSGLLLPVVGWFIGVVLLWISPSWRVVDKVIGTLVVPGGLLAPAIAYFVATGSVASTVDESVSGGIFGLILVGGPLFACWWLVPHARTIRVPVG